MSRHNIRNFLSQSELNPCLKEHLKRSDCESFENAYFIKSWLDVCGHASLHIFYNYNTQSFSALLESQEGIQFIPGSLNGFKLIKIPLLDCKIMKKKLTNLEYPFSSPFKLIQFFRRELRYPIVKESVDGYTIQLNNNGLLGGGGKLSHISYVVSDNTKGEKSNEETSGYPSANNQRYRDPAQKFLFDRYGIDDTLDSKDKQLVEKLAARINRSLPFDKDLSTNQADIEKHLTEFIDVYEEEYFEEVILEVLGKKEEEGRLKLKDYTGNFHSWKLCVEMLRKSFFAKERALGGIEKIIIEKVLASLAEKAGSLMAELKQNIKWSSKIEGEKFEKLLFILQKKEELQAEFQSLTMREAKTRLKTIKDQLQIHTEDQQGLINEYCYSSVLDNDPHRLRRASARTQLLNPIETSNKVEGSRKPEKKENVEDHHTKLPTAVSYLHRLRLNVLSELNLLDHELSTLVELHNLLKLEMVNNHQDMKQSSSHSKSSKFEDIKSFIKSVIKGYRENESNLESNELASLLPLAFIQDPDIYQDFLGVFLEDLRTDIIFDVKKVKMFSFILLGGMKNRDFNKYCKIDNLIQCLKTLQPKIEDLSITAENLNIQEALNSLNDILFLLSFLGAEGIKKDYALMVEDLIKFMETHKLEKAFNLVTKKSHDSSLHMKRKYTLEALKRIKLTKYEAWEENFKMLAQTTQIAVNLGKGISTSDVASINEALFQIKDLIVESYRNKPKSWYDHANQLRLLANEPIENIKKVLFSEGKSYCKRYTFFVTELLLSIITQPLRKSREKKRAAQVLWFLVNGYEDQDGKCLVRSKKFKVNRDIRHYVKKSLLALSLSSDLDFSIFIKKLLEPPITIDIIDSGQINLSASKQEEKVGEKENPGKRFYIKMLMEKKPKLYALAKIEKHSEKTLDKPTILIEFRGIVKEKNFDESMMRKAEEIISKMTGSDLEKFEKVTNDFDTNTKSSILIPTLKGLPMTKGDMKPNQNKETFRNILKNFKEKIHEINEKNTIDLLKVLEEFINEPSKTVLLIQGDAGAGKTLLLHLFEQTLWKRYNTLSRADSKRLNRLPLRIPLSEVRNFDQAVDEFLLQNGCDIEAVNEIKKESAIILFDGYDEINQNINLYNLNKLETWRDVKVIFTSRKENLTALKEDYILCFTPGNDTKKVLTYIIQPINEEQIRKYFDAQVKENEHRIKNIEGKLKAMNGNRASMSSISKVFEKELSFLNKYWTSGRFILLNEVLKILEENMPEVEIFCKNEKDLDSLKKIFEEKLDKLRHLTDEGFLKLIAKKIEINLAVIKEIEDNLEEINIKISKYSERNEIFYKMKRLNKLTSLKKITESLQDIRNNLHNNLEDFNGNLQRGNKDRQGIENDSKSEKPDLVQEILSQEEDDLEEMMNELIKLEEKITPESFKEIVQDLKSKISKVKNFENKLKTIYTDRLQINTVLISTVNAEASLAIIQGFKNHDKLKINFQKLYKSIEEYRTLKQKLNSILSNEKDLLANPKDHKEALTKLDGEKWRTISKMKQQLDMINQIASEKFEVFQDNYFGQIFQVHDHYFFHELSRSSIDNLKEDFNEIQQILNDSEDRLLMFSRNPHSGLTSILQQIKFDFEKILGSIYLENVEQSIKTLEERIAQTKEIIKELLPYKSKINDALDIAEAAENHIELLRSKDGYQKYVDFITKLETIVKEVKAAENESKTIKDDVIHDNSLSIKALNKEMREIERFSDPENLNSIIEKFKDIITSPFMLRMLVQTLIKFPKSSANRAELYRLFATIHFEREKEKLLKTEKVPPKFNVIDSFWQYSKDLAVNMFIRKVVSLQAKSNGYKVLGVIKRQKKDIWSRFFDDQDILAKLSRRGAQIIEDDGSVRFVHKSILEYFAARQFYDEILDFNLDNPEDFEPCLNTGMIVDNETSVYLFMKDIADAQMQNTSESLSTFDKKLLEILDSTPLQKKYGNDFEQNCFYPNIFLLLLLRENLLKRLTTLKEDSIVFSPIVNIFRWIFSSSEISSRFLDVLSKVYEFCSLIFRQLNYFLCFYYHFLTKSENRAELDEKFITFKRSAQAQVKLTKSLNNQINEQDKSFKLKNGVLVYQSGDNYCSWTIDGKFFIHGSLDSVVILQSQENGQYLTFESNKIDTRKRNRDAYGFSLSETNSPWDVKEFKWILRMDQREKELFRLISISDPSKILYGAFENIGGYQMFFKDFCSCDTNAFKLDYEIYYNCITCNMKESETVCKNCAEACHKGHKLTECRETYGGYCDCRFLGCCHLVHGCTARFIEAYNDVVMYRCKQCPTEKKDRLLCLACRKHHEKEHQKFEKIRDSGERCGCNCISSKTKLIAEAIFALVSSEKDAYYSQDNNNRYEDEDEDNDQDEVDDLSIGEEDNDSSNHNIYLWPDAPTAKNLMWCDSDFNTK